MIDASRKRKKFLGSIILLGAMMTTVLLSIGLVSLILVLCAILDTAILRRRLGFQDSICSLACSCSACPHLCLAASLFSEVQIPVIVANSINTDISDSRAIKAPSGNVRQMKSLSTNSRGECAIRCNEHYTCVSPRVDTSNESTSFFQRTKSHVVLPMSISIWLREQRSRLFSTRAVYRRL